MRTQMHPLKKVEYYIARVALNEHILLKKIIFFGKPKNLRNFFKTHLKSFNSMISLMLDEARE